jgi:hypothetical protein
LDPVPFFWAWTLFMDLTTILLEVATLLLDLHTPLLDLRALLLDLALPQTTPPWDRFSKARLGRNSSDSRGVELRYHVTWQGAFQYIVWFNASFPPTFLSYGGAQLGVNLDKSALLGDMHLISISKFPPLCLSSNILHFLHSLGFNIYTSPPSLSATSCIHLVSISKLPPLCLSSNFLHFLHSLGFNIYASP